MRKISLYKYLLVSALLYCLNSHAQTIYVNQVGFDATQPKTALIAVNTSVQEASFDVVNVANGKSVFKNKLQPQGEIKEWLPGKLFYKADFSPVHETGKYMVRVGSILSDTFEVADNFLARKTIPAILHYYHKQRAVTPQELAADKQVQLYGSDKRVDLRGGWCDASGDVSKYFSHLAYANFMSPQQIPLVTWSMVNARERVPALLEKAGVKDSIEQEALYGADYMMRSLSDSGYFYMIVFSYFSKDPNARRVVGLHANSVTTNEYQAAFREGGGMAIAALARIAQWKKNGEYTAEQYLNAAKKAFAHLLVNNTKYDDDGKENIIDDYCALMAATELWIATGEVQYQTEARKRAGNLQKRMTKDGYFIADDNARPYWHASDAGMPVIALARYLDIETDGQLRNGALRVIRQFLVYQLKVNSEVANPFNYARQTFRYKSNLQNGFFIPHDNETGWWWQGENARLGSLAAAALIGSKLLDPKGETDELKTFATDQLSWILGRNPYQTCFMYGFGKNNVPYMHSSFGHGSEVGGVSNGITGKEGNGDGSGIDFKREANGNEWRWTEQWIPHAAWFLNAVVAMQ